jgi:hypothetical protein
VSKLVNLKKIINNQRGVSVLELLIYIALVASVSMAGFFIITTIFDLMARTGQNLDQQQDIELMTRFIQPKVSTTASGNVGVIGDIEAVPEGQQYQEKILQDGPIAYYRLDQATPTSGSAVTSSVSGGLYPGTFNGTGFTSNQSLLPGSNNSAINYGTSLTRSITIADATPLDFLGNQFTLEAWIQRANIANGTRSLIGKGLNNGYDLFITSSNYLQLNIKGQNMVRSADPLNANQVYHIVAVRDGSAQSEIKLYIDGQDVSTYPSSNAPQAMTNISDVLAIGARSTTSQRFSGVIDEVALYNKPLSVLDIQEHYQLGVDGPTPAIPAQSDIILPTSLGNDQFLISHPYNCYRFFYIQRLKQLRVAQRDYSCSDPQASDPVDGILPKRGPNQVITGGVTQYRITDTDNPLYDPILDALPDEADESEPASGSPAITAQSVVLTNNYEMQSGIEAQANYPSAAIPFTFLDAANQSIDIFEGQANSNTDANGTYDNPAFLNEIAAVRFQGFVKGTNTVLNDLRIRPKYFNQLIAVNQICPQIPVN